MRRTPDQARTELLDAAERVFGEFHPDQVGLKDVAAEAGVSHALITHYFKTYAGLVEATFHRRTTAIREEVLRKLQTPGALEQPAELLHVLFRALEDPIQLKLVKWLVAIDRARDPAAMGFDDQGLKSVAAKVVAVASPGAGEDVIDTIELALLTAVSAAYGYALAKHALAGALGRKPSLALAAGVEQTLANMLRAFLRERLGPAIPR